MMLDTSSAMPAKSLPEAKRLETWEQLPNCSEEETSKQNATSNENSHWVKGMQGTLQVKKDLWSFTASRSALWETLMCHVQTKGNL